jgi:predicted ATPase
VEAELIFRRGTPPDAKYRFKHALVRDAAYESLLKAKRLALHARLVDILESRSAAAPEVVAQHAEAAELFEKAVGYWDKAARLAIERSGSVEAVGHFRRALPLLLNLPPSRERDQRESKLQAALGAQLGVTKGYAAPDVEKAFGRARTLCQELGDAPELPPVLFGLWRYYNARARYAESRKMGEQCLALAKKAKDPALILWANYALGWTLYPLGRFNQAREHIEATLRLYEPAAHRALAFVYGTDPGPHSRGLLSWLLWMLGWPERALAESDRALAEAAAGGHKVTLGISQFYAAALHEVRREPQRVAELAADSVAMCREQGVEYYLADATLLQGCVLVQRGDAGAIPSIREGLDAYLKTGALMCTSYHRAKLADAYRAAGRPTEALNVLDEALAFAEQTDERFFEADLHRCRGEVTLLIDAGAVAEAEACFHRALDAARRTEARSLELRAATSLARLWAQQGDRHKAHELLAPVYAWFTEGFETPDLKEAKALLDVLA